MRVRNRGDDGALRADGSRSDKGQERETETRRAVTKESLAKVWESTTKAMSAAKKINYDKDSEKGKERGKKGKGQEKDKKPAP